MILARFWGLSSELYGIQKLGRLGSTNSKDPSKGKGESKRPQQQSNNLDKQIRSKSI